MNLQEIDRRVVVMLSMNQHPIAPIVIGLHQKLHQSDAHLWILCPEASDLQTGRYGKFFHI